MIWDPKTGKQIGRTLSGHKQWITWLAWEPFHLNAECRRLASASKVSREVCIPWLDKRLC